MRKGFVLRFCGAAGLPAALVLGLLLGAGSASTVLPRLVPSEPAPAPATTATLHLSIDPSSWWMVAGNSTRLEATWVGVPPGCTEAPVAFHWSIVTGWAEGMLAPLDGPSTNFTASSTVTGTAEIEVRSATVVTCGTGESAWHQNATASVTVVVPPTLGPLAFDTDPVAAGASTNLTGSLVDGAPPYRIRVAWGDGNVSESNLSAPGPFALPHRFPDGRFVPTVTVEDSVGLTTNGSVVEPEYAGANFTVGIETARYATEVGASVAFTGGILDPPASYSEAAICSDALASAAAPPRLAPAGNGTADHFTCAFAAPGTAEVTYEVVPSGGDLSPASATLTLPVSAPLALKVFLTDSSTEVDLPTAVAVAVSGGVAPFFVRWGLADSPNGSRTTLVADGTYLMPVDPTTPGDFGVTVIVEDAIGFEVGNSSARLSVDGALNATASVASGSDPAGARVSLAGAVTQGVAPFLWFVAPAVPPENGTPPEGNLSAVSGFAWSALLPREGNSSITVGVVDAAGAIWWSDLPVHLVAPLDAAGAWTVSPGNRTPLLVLHLTVEGGLPPFTLWANSTGGPVGNASLYAEGSTTWSWPVDATGVVGVEVVVADRLGARGSWNSTVNLSAAVPGPSPAPPSPTPPVPAPATGSDGADGGAQVATVSVLVLLVAGGVGLYWRHRRSARTPASPPPDPVTVLRRIVEPADGIDRTTVELLAEEAGVSLPVVRATLDRLVTEGRLRSETGSDGEEVYAWSPTDAP